MALLVITIHQEMVQLMDDFMTCDNCKYLALDIAFCTKHNLFVPYVYDYDCPHWELKEVNYEIIR